MTRDLETLRTHHHTLQTAANQAQRDAQAAQETAKFAYSTRLGPCPDAMRRAEKALEAWYAADDAARCARRALIEAEEAARAEDAA